MRQIPFIRPILIVLVVVAGLGGCAASSSDKTQSRVEATEDKKNNDLIPLLLPPNVKVILKQGGTKSGRLKSIDAKTQQLTIYSGRDSQVAIAKVDKLVFDGEVVLQARKIVIRGEDKSSASDGETWNEPLENFTVRDPIKGEAELKLSSLDFEKRKGIQSVAKDSSYIVEEIQFQSSKMLKMQVTPR